MRQFVIDELSPLERDNLDSYLKRNLRPGTMAGLYWLVLPPERLSGLQQEHADCQPYYLGVEAARDQIKFELLVRSSNNLHCQCIAYADHGQRQFAFDFIDKMIEEEKIAA